jgi:predicted alpha/beta-hydrolase family hydrolase
MDAQARLSVEVAGEGAVTALWYRAAAPSERALVLGHGAGADQTSEFMVSFAAALAARGLEVLTFNFPYTEKKRGRPDRPSVLEATWRAVIARVRAEVKPRVLAIGGKSMGGRIASMVAAAGERVDGLCFVGYPLHPPKQPDKLRAEHLARVGAPMLFVQGARDTFGSEEELRRALAEVQPSPELLFVAEGDHSLKVPKRAGVEQAQVFADAQARIAAFVNAL